MFHLPVTKYQKLTSQVQPYLSPVHFPVSLSRILSDWEITALDKQTGKHSRNYVVVLMIREKTPNSNAESKLWLLWQHRMSQSWLWANNLAWPGGELWEVFAPESSDFHTCAILLVSWHNPKLLSSLVYLRQQKSCCAVIPIPHVCENPPVDELWKHLSVTASSWLALDGHKNWCLLTFLSLGSHIVVPLPEVIDHLANEDSAILLNSLHQSSRVACKRG